MSTVQVGNRTITITHPDKILFPQVGFTKSDLVDYYLAVADVLVPHLRDRPLSIIRYPEGVSKAGFFAKQAPGGMPSWVRTANLPSPSSAADRTTIDYVVVDDAATLAWLANLSAIELHVPQWHITDRLADHLVFDLDPGEGAGIAECCAVALLLRESLRAEGLEGYPKTSGGKGLHLYAPIDPADPGVAHSYAKELARQLEREHPALIVSNMRKELRKGKVFIDWSQNNASKTTVAPYSVRAKAVPTVSAPLSWWRVQSGAKLQPEPTPQRSNSNLQFGPSEVRKNLARIRKYDIPADLL